MAFVESDRVGIRRWLGVPAIFTQAEPRLESAITAVQSIADGGTRPDSSTETAIKSYLTQLSTIENQIQALYDEMQAYKLAEMTVDPLRAIAGLQKVGRMYIGHIADAVNHPPIRDVFSGSGAGAGGHGIL